MGSACVLYPSVKNPSTGATESSILYKDVLNYNGNDRSLANYIYNKVTSKDFSAFDKKYNLQKDHLGQPTIASMVDVLFSRFNNGKLVEGALKELNSEFSYSSNIDYSYLGDIKSVVNTYNSRGKLSPTTTMYHEITPEGVSIKIKKKDSILEQKQREQLSLTNRLTSILRSHGLGVGVLTESERRLGILGVASVDTTKRTADGLIEVIRLSKGDNYEATLVEEFAHVMLNMLDKNHPLVQRFRNTVTEDMVQEILGEEYIKYRDLYNNNSELLMEEALGKILASSILNEGNSNPLLDRLLSVMKSKLSEIDYSSFESKVKEIKKYSNGIAVGLLNNTLKESVDITHTTIKKDLYQIDKGIKESLEDILKEMQKSNILRFNIAKTKGINTENYLNQIDKIEEYISNEDWELGVVDFLGSTVKEINRIYGSITGEEYQNADLKSKAKRLKTAISYISYVQNVVKDLNTILAPSKFDKDKEALIKTLNSYVNNINTTLSNIQTIIRTQALDISVNFYKQYVDDSNEVIINGDKYNVKSLEELFSKSEDISFMEKWLDSLSHTSDPLLRITDKILKQAHHSARLEFLDIRKEIEALGLKYEKLGIKDYSFMYKRNKKGEITPYHITPINWSAYFEKRKEILGEFPTEDEVKAFNAKYTVVTEEDGRIPDFVRHPEFADNEYKKLSQTQRAFIKEYLDIKRRLDKKLPRGSTVLGRAVLVRKSEQERFFQNGAVSTFKNMRNVFSITSSDVEILGSDTLIDFEGKLVLGVPLYYLNMKKDETMQDFSLDAVGNLIAYAAMATNNQHKREVVDLLEVASLQMQKFSTITDGQKKMVIETAAGVSEYEVTKDSIKSNRSERLDMAFNMLLYGISTEKSEVEVFGKKLNVAKGLNKLTSLSGFSTMSLNILNATANIAQGLISTLIEQAASEFFSTKDIMQADRIYASYFPELISELGMRTKRSKLSVVSEFFDFTQDTMLDAKETKFNKKAWMAKMFDLKHLSFLQTSGEHYLKTRIGLAVLLNTKVLDAKGNQISLWDAIITEPSNKDVPGSSHVVKIKQGVKTLEGEVLDEAKLKELNIKLTKKISGLNNYINGIYNDIDRVALQYKAWGGLALIYRKWMKPAFNRRFKRGIYNYDLDQYYEGYYRTALSFTLGLLKDIKNMQLNISRSWDQLDNHQKANMRRALAESVVTLLLFAATMLFKIKDGDDEEDENAENSWWYNFLEYQIFRLYTEMGFMSVTAPFQMVESTYLLFKSPSGVMNTLERTTSLFQFMTPDYWGLIQTSDDPEDEEEVYTYPSGRFKGMTKFERAIMKFPLFGPVDNIHKAVHVDEMAKFYKTK